MNKISFLRFKGALTLSVAVACFFAIQSGIVHFNASNQAFRQVIFPRPVFPAATAARFSDEKHKPAEQGKETPMAVSEVMRLIDDAALRHDVPAEVVRSIIAAESNFNSNAVSHKGAVGLMQLMPTTAQMLGVNPHVPAQNVDGGTHYLRILMDRYRSYGNWLPRVVAAYNAGPGMVDKYHGVPPFRETRAYVTRVLTQFHRFAEPSGNSNRIAALRHHSVCRG